jgi:predicted nucleotidyltransferase
MGLRRGSQIGTLRGCDMEPIPISQQTLLQLQTDKLFIAKIKTLSKKIVPILKKNGVLSASLFGSIVRNQDSPQSDIDILVQYKDGTTLLDVAGLQLELENMLGRKVDLVSEKYLHQRIQNNVHNQRIQIL